MKHISFLFLAIILIGLSSCEDDTLVGSDLLESEELEILYTDDFDLLMTQIGPSPVINPVQLNGASNVVLGTGQIADEDFGALSASMYLRPFFSGDFIPTDPKYIYDSITLTLEVDTSLFYGFRSARYDIEVYEVTETIDDIFSQPSDREYSIDEQPIGYLESIRPSDLDSVRFNLAAGDSIWEQNILSIKLSDELGQRIFSDTTNNNNRGFNDLVNGLYLRASTTENGMFFTNLSAFRSGLTFHFHTNDTLVTATKRLDINRYAYLDHDVASSALAQNIGSVHPDVLFAQGMGGASIEVDLSDILRIDDAFVNHAALELTVVHSDIDTVSYPLPERLAVAARDTSGYFTAIPGTGAIRGLSQDIDGLKTYQLNITTFVKELQKGKVDPKVYITLPNPIQSPNKVIFYGPNHPEYPAKLNFTYTKS